MGKVHHTYLTVDTGALVPLTTCSFQPQSRWNWESWQTRAHPPWPSAGSETWPPFLTTCPGSPPHSQAPSGWTHISLEIYPNTFWSKNRHTQTHTHTPIQDYTTDNVLTNKQMCDSSKSITPGQLHMKHASQTHLVGEGLRKPHTTRRKCVQTSVTPIWVWTGSAAVPCALNLWGGRETRHHFATSIWKVQHNYMVFYKEQTFLQSKR